MYRYPFAAGTATLDTGLDCWYPLRSLIMAHPVTWLHPAHQDERQHASHRKSLKFVLTVQNFVSFCSFSLPQIFRLPIMRHVGPSYIGIDESDDQVEIINILCRANIRNSCAGVDVVLFLRQITTWVSPEIDYERKFQGGLGLFQLFWNILILISGLVSVSTQS